MRVLVCGARDYPHKYKVWTILSAIQSSQSQPLIIIEGKCHKGGADLWAEKWALAHVPEENHLPFPADWKRYKKAAGPIRNKQMLEQGKPDLVLAFGGKNGTGTNHMVRIAKAAEVPVLEYDRD